MPTDRLLDYLEKMRADIREDITTKSNVDVALHIHCIPHGARI